MKKVLICVLVFVLLFSNQNVSATCYDDTLNNWAEKLSIKQVIINDSYTAPEGVDQEELSYYSYLLMLNNPRTDLKVTAKDTYSGGSYNVDYDSAYKNFVMGSEVHSRDKTYTISIYMNDNATSCAGELMKTITYTVPKYNNYHDTVYCEENPDDESCGAYTKVNNTEKIEELIKDNYNEMIKDEEYRSSSFFEKVWILIKEYYLYILIPIVLLTIIYEAVIFITKKRREKK